MSVQQITHREAIKAWLGVIELKDCRIIDWGSGAKPVRRYIKHENCDFITIDKNKLIDSSRRAKRHFLHNIEEYIELPAADVAFCIEVLEHSMRPEMILFNIWSNLKEGGTLYLSVPFMFRIHSEDDYLRYTEHWLRAVFKRIGFTIDYLTESVGDEGYLVKAIR